MYTYIYITYIYICTYIYIGGRCCSASRCDTFDGFACCDYARGHWRAGVLPANNDSSNGVQVDRYSFYLLYRQSSTKSDGRAGVLPANNASSTSVQVDRDAVEAASVLLLLYQYRTCTFVPVKQVEYECNWLGDVVGGRDTIYSIYLL